MNTRLYLLVLSIALIVEGSPLPCSCKSGLNSPLESTACSCSEKVVIPAQFTAVRPPPCNCQSSSQPRPQPVPCIPQQSQQQPQPCIPQQSQQQLQPCIPLPTPPKTVQPPCAPNQTPCIPASSGSQQPWIPAGSSSGSQQPCIPAGSSSGSQPCVPTPVKPNSNNCIPAPSIQYTLPPSSNKIPKKDWFQKKEKSQLEGLLDDTTGLLCNKDGIFGGKTTVCMKWPSWMADMVQKFKCKVNCWSKSHDPNEPLIL